MRKNKSLLGWKVFALSMVLPCIALGQVGKHLSYSFTDMERTTLKKQGNSYEKVKLKMAFQSQDVGKPDLPVYYYKFYVPRGKGVSRVAFSSSGQQELQLSSDLLPAQHAVRISQIGVDTLFDAPDQSVYGKDTYYPETQAAVLRSDFVDGDMEVVTITVYPMQYNPKQRRVKLSTGAELYLTLGSGVKSASSGIFVGHTNSKEMSDIVKSLVENPNDVPSTQQEKTIIAKGPPIPPGPPDPPGPPTDRWSVPFYEYVIVTSRALKPAFTQLVSWKRRKGYNAGVVCIEDIVADPAAAGDPLSPTLTDNAGKLRQYLFDSYNSSSPQTKYVLLGGDYAIVPIRYGYGGFGWDDGSGKIPSDLYFSDFNTNWTAVSTAQTGTYYSGFDYGPEIFVGRLLCNSELDITTWTAKAMLYEQNPGNGDYSYLSKSLFTEADGVGVISTSVLPTIFTAKNVWKELPSDGDWTPYFPKGADVISELNTRYGFYSIFNHGGPHNFGTALMGYNGYGDPLIRYQVTCADSYVSDGYITPESGNGFDNLTNSDFSTIIYSLSCLNMPFDSYRTTPGFRNLGASFTVVSNGGGPAYLGNTRDGWAYYGHNLETNFFNNLASFPQLGIAEGNSKIGLGHHWSCLAHNLLGCPETPMWSASPTTFSGATVTQIGSTVTVNTGGVTADRICVMNALNTGYFQVRTGVSSYSFPNVTQPYYVTITKANKIPYRYSPSAVYIQNQTIRTTAYLNCQTVAVGYSVTSSQAYGNVTFLSRANITLDVTGDAVLDKGFEVKSGAFFEVK